MSTPTKTISHKVVKQLISNYKLSPDRELRSKIIHAEMPRIQALCKKIYFPCLELSERLSIATLKVYECLETYKNEPSTTFYNYYSFQVRYALINYNKINNQQFREILLDEDEADDDTDEEEGWLDHRGMLDKIKQLPTEDQVVLRDYLQRPTSSPDNLALSEVLNKLRAMYALDARTPSSTSTSTILRESTLRYASERGVRRSYVCRCSCGNVFEILQNKFDPERGCFACRKIVRG